MNWTIDLHIDTLILIPKLPLHIIAIMLGLTSKMISRKLSHAPQIASLTSTQSKSLSTTQPARGVTLLQDKQNGFGFARSNPRPVKPRSKGVTEIRGPYYSVECIHQLCLYCADFGIGDGEALSGRRIRNVTPSSPDRYLPVSAILTQAIAWEIMSMD